MLGWGLDKPRSGSYTLNYKCDDGNTSPTLCGAERPPAGEKGGAGGGEYIPEQRVEGSGGASVGPAVRASLQRRGVKAPAATQSARPANRGGTASFPPSANLKLAGGFFCPLPQITTRRKKPK